MAEKKKDKKYKGGPSKKSYLRNMAKRAVGTYAKYGDQDKKNVHQGDATYRGITKSDNSPLPGYALNVYRGHGKEYFIYKGTGTAPGGDLKKSDGGASAVKVKI